MLFLIRYTKQSINHVGNSTRNDVEYHENDKLVWFIVVMVVIIMMIMVVVVVVVVVVVTVVVLVSVRGGDGTLADMRRGLVETCVSRICFESGHCCGANLALRPGGRGK